MLLNFFITIVPADVPAPKGAGAIRKHINDHIVLMQQTDTTGQLTFRLGLTLNLVDSVNGSTGDPARHQA